MVEDQDASFLVYRYLITKFLSVMYPLSLTLFNGFSDPQDQISILTYHEHSRT